MPPELAYSEPLPWQLRRRSQRLLVLGVALAGRLRDDDLIDIEVENWPWTFSPGE